jgi:predicted tellurium resistance membrane protein TerC
MDAFFTSSGLVALITLTFLEIVLGVDNVILHFDPVEQEHPDAKQTVRLSYTGNVGNRHF